MAARRRRILDGAAGLLAEGGPAELSMRRLADAADVSVNTIYNLIGGREAVIAALVDEVIGVIAPLVDEADSSDAIARCVAIVAGSTSAVIESHELTRPLAQEIFGHGGPGSALSHSWGTRTLQEAIEGAVELGLLDDSVSPSALAETVYAVWANTALRWAHGAIDDDGFEALTLTGLYVALLAVSTDDVDARLHRALGEPLETDGNQT